MLTLTPRVKSSQFQQSQGQSYRSKLGLTLKVWVTEQGQGQGQRSRLKLLLRVRVIAWGKGQHSGFRSLFRVSADAQCQGQRQFLVLGSALTLSVIFSYIYIHVNIYRNLCLPFCRIVLKLYPQDPGTPLVVYVQMLQTMRRQYLKSSTVKIIKLMAQCNEQEK